MKKDENGYIVVETLGAFIPFILLIMAILSFVNIVTLQSRIHYALTQTANTMSVYCYVLEVTGIADKFVKNDEAANKAAEDVEKVKSYINEVIDGINTLSIEKVIPSSDVIDMGEDIIDNPKEFIEELIKAGLNSAVSKARNAAFGELSRLLMGRYLSNGTVSGDEYLKSVNVFNSKTNSRGLAALQFYDLSEIGSKNDSVLIDSNGDVKITVKYEIESRYLSIILPFKPKVSITQTVKTKAWLNGSGKGYVKNGD